MNRRGHCHPSKSEQQGRTRRRQHLVVVEQRYIRAMLAGTKSIEARLSRMRKPPWGEVAKGDLLWLKPPSRPITALAVAGRCRFESPTCQESVIAILSGAANEIAAQPGFFDAATPHARFVSLIEIARVVALNPIPFQKRDRRAWVVLDGPLYPNMNVAGLREDRSR